LIFLVGIILKIQLKGVLFSGHPVEKNNTTEGVIVNNLKFSRKKKDDTMRRYPKFYFCQKHSR